MNLESVRLVKEWYYQNFDKWELNPYPKWTDELLNSRKKEKIITLDNLKLTWQSVNNEKEHMKYKEIFVKLAALPTKEEVAYSIHGKILSDINDNWDNELQCKSNPAGIINIENAKFKNYYYPIFSGLFFIISLSTIGYFYI